MIAHDYLTERTSRRRLEAAYPMPRECRSLYEWLRARNLDLPELDGVDLDREHFRVSHRLAIEPDRHCRAWLVQRRQAIEAERARRRGGRP